MKTMKKSWISRPFAGLALLACLVLPQGVAADGEVEQSFDQTASSVEGDLAAALAELSALRERIAREKLPLSKQLSRLESELVSVRREYEQLGRQLDTQNLDLGNLRSEIEGRKGEQSYLANLLDEYIRNLETRLHITELQRYRQTIDEARRAPQNPLLDKSDVFEVQVGMVDTSLERLEELLGGTSFAGQAVGEGGLVEDVEFVLVGPSAFFSAKSSDRAGLAEQRLGSLEPNMIALDNPSDGESIRTLAASGSGVLPFDPTLGNAQKIEETNDTVFEHISKGGPVMVPILAMALASLLVALWKWVQLARIRVPSQRRVRSLLEALLSRDMKAAAEKVEKLPGPTGEMLKAGVEHAHEPKDLVEEVMFESMLETKLKLNSLLPFVAICAAAAPLMGLLGTVTGIINTFKLITVFGTGDPKTLSSGISEALITTEFGLIVAIPSLLLHAYLSRRARRLVDGMEKTAISFVNRLAVGAAKPEAAEAS